MVILMDFFYNSARVQIAARKGDIGDHYYTVILYIGIKTRHYKGRFLLPIRISWNVSQGFCFTLLRYRLGIIMEGAHLVVVTFDSIAVNGFFPIRIFWIVVLKEDPGYNCESVVPASHFKLPPRNLTN